MEPKNRIKTVLTEKGKTSRWLAGEIGKDVTTISKWCTNRSQPSLSVLYMIADVLEIDVRDLLIPSKINIKKFNLYNNNHYGS